MHMGSMACSSALGLTNLRHVLLNNDAHESVGGQPTASSQRPAAVPARGPGLDFAAVAAAAGYVGVGSAATAAELRTGLQALRGDGSAHPSQVGVAEGAPVGGTRLQPRAGPRLLEVRTRLGTPGGLGRPRHGTAEAKAAYMLYLQQGPAEPKNLSFG